MPYANSEEHKLRKKEWYEKNKSLSSQRAKEARERKREWYQALMSDKFCERCGESDQIVLEWHHRDPSVKEGSVSWMMDNRGRQTILEEISKCQCLCANCHRRVHHELRNGV